MPVTPAQARCPATPPQRAGGGSGPRASCRTPTHGGRSRHSPSPATPPRGQGPFSPPHCGAHAPASPVPPLAPLQQHREMSPCAGRRSTATAAQEMSPAAGRRSNAAGQDGRMLVAVRVRSDGDPPCISCDEARASVQLAKTGRELAYDDVFCGGQDQVYQQYGRPMIAEAFQGYHCCLFAYGQTGSGKTYTLQGMPGAGIAPGAPWAAEDEGIMPRFLRELFAEKQERLSKDRLLQVLVSMSVAEVYNEEVRDLLSGSDRGLPLVEDPETRLVMVQGLTAAQVDSAAHALELLRAGNAARETAPTGMNKCSSRSHMIVQLHLLQRRHDARGYEACMKFVDLAGSENISRAGTEGRKQESGCINRSLLCLGKALSAFAGGRQHGEMRGMLRESKLTRLLAESFGGNSKTRMLAMVSAKAENEHQTQSTLHYANHAKRIRLHATQNELRERKENEEVLRQLRAVSAELAALQDSAAETQQRADDAEARAAQADEALAAKGAELQACSSELACCQDELSTAQEALAALRVQLASASERAAEAEAEAAATRAELCRAEEAAEQQQLHHQRQLEELQQQQQQQQQQRCPSCSGASPPPVGAPARCASASAPCAEPRRQPPGQHAARHQRQQPQQQGRGEPLGSARGPPARPAAAKRTGGATTPRAGAGGTHSEQWQAALFSVATERNGLRAQLRGMEGATARQRRQQQAMKSELSAASQREAALAEERQREQGRRDAMEKQRRDAVLSVHALEGRIAVLTRDLREERAKNQRLGELVKKESACAARMASRSACTPSRGLSTGPLMRTPRTPSAGVGLGLRNGGHEVAPPVPCPHLAPEEEAAPPATPPRVRVQSPASSPPRPPPVREAPETKCIADLFSEEVERRLQGAVSPEALEALRRATGGEAAFLCDVLPEDLEGLPLAQARGLTRRLAQL